MRTLTKNFLLFGMFVLTFGMMVLGCDKKAQRNDNDNQEQIVISFPRVGKWEIIARQPGYSFTGTSMVIEEIDEENFNGYFDWKVPDTIYGGREYFRGVYNTQSKTVSIKGVRLENAMGIMLSTYEAHLSEDGYDLEDGTWQNGGVWKTKWKK
jgi:hypothetical protein